ncbi:hypothetical protein F8M41_023699 [Gigaspora margarita]|uniref:Uncharacterized protein n=1 Tax=Gigaspora margarita TaxID=4874 RepID=A0A8H4EGS0_GIGMA|nr:hypothetical protein F8M41_023699 [Gigaspora margarita]
MQKLKIFWEEVMKKCEKNEKPAKSTPEDPAKSAKSISKVPEFDQLPNSPILRHQVHLQYSAKHTSEVSTSSTFRVPTQSTSSSIEQLIAILLWKMLTPSLKKHISNLLMFLPKASEEVLQATVEQYIPSRYFVPGLQMIMDDHKVKRSGWYGFWTFLSFQKMETV